MCNSNFEFTSSHNYDWSPSLQFLICYVETLKTAALFTATYGTKVYSTTDAFLADCRNKSYSPSYFLMTTAKLNSHKPNQLPYSGKFSRMCGIEHFAIIIFSRISAIGLSLSTKNKTFADNIFANSL